MKRTLSTAEVSRILGLGESRVRKMVRAGFCRPERTGRTYGFSFQDLVVLRAAHGLALRNVPPVRVRRALQALAKELPAGRSVAGLRIYADGRRVAVRDGKTTWEPETGQTVLDFGLDDLARKVATLDRFGKIGRGDASEDRKKQAAAEFEHALELEDDDPARARAGYRRALQLHPGHADAWVNLGRLLHQGGAATEAAACYRRAIAVDPDDAIAHFNLGLALEKSEGAAAARRAYERALEIDSSLADAHWNLAVLCEETGRERDALRHYAAYRRLTRDR